MFYLITAFLLFLLAVIVHIIWCRLFFRKRLTMGSLVGLALSFLSVYFFIASETESFQRGHKIDARSAYFIARPDQPLLGVGLPSPFWSVPLKFSALLLYLLFIPVYLIFYFGTRVESPSKRILLLLGQKGRLSLKEILTFLNEETVMMARLEDLCRCGYAIISDNKYRLSKSGGTVARILNIYQLISGRARGG